MTPVLVTDLAMAVVLGGALGIGVCALFSLAPRWGAPTLARRIAPYIRDVIDPRGIALVAPSRGPAVWEGLVERATRMLGGADAVSRKLARAGWSMDVAAFRGRTLVWALVGLAAGGAIVVALALAGRMSPPAVLVPPICAVAGAVLCDLHLQRAARARVARIEDELPTVLEFLALCLSAGEGILDSLRRIGSVGVGELTSELRDAVVAVGTGSSLSDALLRTGQRLQIPALSRSIDHIVAALDRGAPLAQVLQDQASDAREDAKRTLIESAGRKEIYMLVPVNTELRSFVPVLPVMLPRVG